jgi:RNA polymerase sigma-70 factor (ECF subfamily)
MTTTSSLTKLPSQRNQNVSELAVALATLRSELFVHALRLSRNANLAEDLVQDTVVRALRFESNFEKGSNLRAWVHQILFNVFISRCRQQRRELKAIGSLSTDPCAWTIPVSGSVQSSQLTEATQRALKALPERFRIAVQLVDLQEQSYREVADELGVPVGTIMSRLHRGRRLLADALREQPVAAAA